MHRVDDASAAAALPVALPVGPNPDGFFADNTIVQRDYMNAIQEEICGLIEAADVTLDKTKNDQLRTAIFNAVHAWTRQQYFAQVDLVEAAITDWDLDLAQTALLTLTADRTLASPTNMRAGARYILTITQDAIGGHTLTFDSDYRIKDIGNLSEIASDTTVIEFYCTGTKMLGGVLTGNYDADVIAHLNRITTSDLTLLDDLNMLIVTLKNIGVWDLLDVICVVHDNAADSLLSLKGATYDATNINAAAFVANRGFTPDSATNAYIDTNFIPSAAGVLADQSDSFFIYKNTAIEGDIPIHGAYQSSAGEIINLKMIGVITAISQDAAVSYYSQQLNSATVSPAGLVPIGFAGGTRRTNGDVEVRADGLNSINTPITSNGLLNSISLFVGAQNYGGTPSDFGVDQISCWGAGGALTTQQLSDLRDAIQTYMVARGANL